MRQQKLSRFLQKNKTLSIGLIIVIAYALVAIFGPSMVSHDPYHQNIRNRLLAPSSNHIFGTDHFGRDLFSRVIWGTRISFVVGLGSVALSIIFGTIVGLLAGYFPRVDNFLMRAMDGVMAFPSTLLAMALMAILDPGLVNIIVAISIVYTPRSARIIRGQVLSLKEYEFIYAIKALGASNLRIMLKHILPNCFSPVLVQSTFVFAQAVIIESTLSFLGLGMPPPNPSWGAILNESQNYMMDAEWCVVFPALAFMICIVGINLFGDGLRDYLDPRMK